MDYNFKGLLFGNVLVKFYHQIINPRSCNSQKCCAIVLSTSICQSKIITVVQLVNIQCITVIYIICILNSIKMFKICNNFYNTVRWSFLGITNNKTLAPNILSMHIPLYAYIPIIKQTLNYEQKSSPFSSILTLKFSITKENDTPLDECQ